MLKKGFLLTIALFFSSLTLAKPIQIEVSSTQGWQTINFEQPVTRISSITGGWSVGRHNYVGPSGHYGDAATALTPFNHAKYDRNYAFGALLIKSKGNENHMDVSGPITFQEPVTSLSLRINDKDDALGDNRGSLLVTFE